MPLTDGAVHTSHHIIRQMQIIHAVLFHVHANPIAEYPLNIIIVCLYNVPLLLGGNKTAHIKDNVKLLFPNRRFAFSSYCASLSTALTAFLISLFTAATLLYRQGNAGTASEGI